MDLNIQYYLELCNYCLKLSSVDQSIVLWYAMSLPLNLMCLKISIQGIFAPSTYKSILKKNNPSEWCKQFLTLGIIEYLHTILLLPHLKFCKKLLTVNPEWKKLATELSEWQKLDNQYDDTLLDDYWINGIQPQIVLSHPVKPILLPSNFLTTKLTK